jgi:hypothetical protein
MANDSLFPEEGKRPAKDTSSDSGLGNLPPLSDFDSQAGLTPSDSGALPPRQLQQARAARAACPRSATSTLKPRTRPAATSARRPRASAAASATRSPPAPALRRPPTPPAAASAPRDASAARLPGSRGGQRFLARDPGDRPRPDSNVDTPMFDSAFGGGSGGFGAAVSTPMATQAMETPMFGGSTAPPAGGGGAFGKDTFGGGFDFNAGTPPARLLPRHRPAPAVQPPTTGADGGKKGGKKAPKGGGGGGGSPAVLAGMRRLPRSSSASSSDRWSAAMSHSHSESASGQISELTTKQ